MPNPRPLWETGVAEPLSTAKNLNSLNDIDVNFVAPKKRQRKRRIEFRQSWWGNGNVAPRI